MNIPSISNNVPTISLEKLDAAVKGQTDTEAIKLTTKSGNWEFAVGSQTGPGDNRYIREAVLKSLLAPNESNDKSLASLQDSAKAGKNTKIIADFLTGDNVLYTPLKVEDVKVLLCNLKALSACKSGQKSYYAETRKSKMPKTEVKKPASGGKMPESGVKMPKTEVKKPASEVGKSKFTYKRPTLPKMSAKQVANLKPKNGVVKETQVEPPRQPVVKKTRVVPPRQPVVKKMVSGFKGKIKLFQNFFANNPIGRPQQPKTGKDLGIQRGVTNKTTEEHGVNPYEETVGQTTVVSKRKPAKKKFDL